MAQQQFNDWDPTRSGLEGNMMAQPRVFVHDAALIVIGALNCSDANFGISITDPGDDFVVGETVDITTAGTDAVLTVDEISETGGGPPNSGIIINYHIDCDDAGTLYAVGDVIAGLSGSGAGNGLDLVITNIDIPGTQKRGCCLYNGNAAAQSITVVMEGATYDGSIGTGYDATVTFPNVPSGSFLPIEVVQLVTGTSVLALY